jgi:hypothetical protein
MFNLIKRVDVEVIPVQFSFVRDAPTILQATRCFKLVTSVISIWVVVKDVARDVKACSRADEVFDGSRKMALAPPKEGSLGSVLFAV